jgi:hypothetical protein
MIISRREIFNRTEEAEDKLKAACLQHTNGDKQKKDVCSEELCTKLENMEEHYRKFGLQKTENQ